MLESCRWHWVATEGEFSATLKFQLFPYLSPRSYYSVIQAGNISFRVALDTASSDLWILSSACASGTCKGIPSYPLSYASPSFESVNNNETSFNLSFADGSGKSAPAIHRPVVFFRWCWSMLVSSGFLARESITLQNFTMPDQVLGNSLKMIQRE